MPTRFDRRTTLTAIATMGAGAMLPPTAHAATQLLTPAQSTGPFYPTDAMRFTDQDHDLVKVSDRVRAAGGEILWLKGQVFSGGDTPAPGARVEIWQTDMNGRYLHTGDRASHAGRDLDFQGFGVSIADPDGFYRFRTIKPVPYPGRTPHIHVRVIDAGRTLTTQFYVADHERNDRDGLWRRLTPDQRTAVAMRYVPRRDGDTEAVVDIGLG